MADAGPATVRRLRPEDLDRVVEIDAQNVGRARRVFFEKRLEAALADPDVFLTVAVERAGRADGFAIVRIQAGEFGDDRPVAILDVIGVAPDAQHAGLGHALIDGLDAGLKKRGVHEVRTQVDWSEQPLLGFFADTGFALAARTVLERSTDRAWDIQ